MQCIRVEPETLREIAQRLRAVADELRQLAGRVGGAVGGVDWQTRQASGVEGHCAGARSRAEALAGEIEALARYLEHKAEAFAEADAAGAAALGRVLAAQTTAGQMLLDRWRALFEPWASLPCDLAGRALASGGLLDDEPPGLTAAQVSGLSALLAGQYAGTEEEGTRTSADERG